MTTLFAGALALSALLLFSVQPMVGKSVLPVLGGTPQVWNTCMVFFQAMLFLGYLHAHLSSRWLGHAGQALIHLAVAIGASFTLPFGWQLASASSGSHEPMTWLLGYLVGTLGPAAFVLSSTAPLVQKWFAAAGHHRSSDPYFLYVASNVGSLAALLAYPALVEPSLELREQWSIWSWGYVVLLVVLGLCALSAWRGLGRAADTGPAPAALRVERPTAAQRLKWLLLSFAPSSLLLGVTTYLTTDLAPVPLFWVVPLALYLLTFVMAFAARPRISAHVALKGQTYGVVLVVALSVFPGLAALLSTVTTPLHLGAFFFSALVCHRALVALRPASRYLTEFYLWMSAGGLMGGLFNALLAPVLFDRQIEYSLALALVCWLRIWAPAAQGGAAPTSSRPAKADLLFAPVLVGLLVAGLWVTTLMKADWPRVSIVLALCLLPALGVALLSASPRPLRFALTVAAVSMILPFVNPQQRQTRGELELAERSYFGLYAVHRLDTSRMRVFMHGSTAHGAQSTDPERRLEISSYYHRAGPFGSVFAHHARRGSPHDVGVVGLGVGVLSCYGSAQDQWTFFEIDPLVERIARETRLFTFMRDCPPRKTVKIGDARLTLKDMAPGQLGVLVIDAFTSDAIPTHLLTREALRLYRDVLAPDGWLVIHISNRHLDLAPVVAGLARDAGMAGRVNVLKTSASTDALHMSSPALVAVLANDETQLGTLRSDPYWQALPEASSTRVWTDGHVNVLGALRLFR